jgi:hypothetical protein
MKQKFKYKLIVLSMFKATIYGRLVSYFTSWISLSELLSFKF